MMTCGVIPHDGMLRSHAEARRSGGLSMALISTRLRLGGFTLIEMLVVIGIIAVLIAILLPVLGKARAQANRVACLSNIKQVGTAILMYCNDNDGWFPTCARVADGLAHVQYPDDWVHWQSNRDVSNSAVARYAGRGEKLRSLLRCPADMFEGRKTYPASLPGEGPYMYSYSMNDALGVNIKGGEPQGYRTKIGRWRSSSRKIMVTESEGMFHSPSWHPGSRLTRRHGTGRFHKNIPGFPEMSFGAKIGVNVSDVFLDGHGDSIDQDVAYDQIHGLPEAQRG